MINISLGSRRATTAFCAGIVKHSIDYYISTGNFGVLARCRNFFGPHVGAPVRPNMLNMPKSASGEVRCIMTMASMYNIDD